MSLTLEMLHQRGQQQNFTTTKPKAPLGAGGQVNTNRHQMFGLKCHQQAIIFRLRTGRC